MAIHRIGGCKGVSVRSVVRNSNFQFTSAPRRHCLFFPILVAVKRNGQSEFPDIHEYSDVPIFEVVRGGRFVVLYFGACVEKEADL